MGTQSRWCSVSLTLDFWLEESARLISNVSAPVGRSEFVSNNIGLYLVIDYAHIPDGLENILSAIRIVTRGRLRVLFGCRGNKDIGKRAEMSKIAEVCADKVVWTADNSRSEKPEDIIEDLAEEIASKNAFHVSKILDQSFSSKNRDN